MTGIRIKMGGRGAARVGRCHSVVRVHLPLVLVKNAIVDKQKKENSVTDDKTEVRTESELRSQNCVWYF